MHIFSPICKNYSYYFPNWLKKTKKTENFRLRRTSPHYQKIHLIYIKKGGGAKNMNCKFNIHPWKCTSIYNWFFAFQFEYNILLMICKRKKIRQACLEKLTDRQTDNTDDTTFILMIMMMLMIMEELFVWGELMYRRIPPESGRHSGSENLYLFWTKTYWDDSTEKQFKQWT